MNEAGNKTGKKNLPCGDASVRGDTHRSKVCIVMGDECSRSSLSKRVRGGPGDTAATDGEGFTEKAVFE